MLIYRSVYLLRFVQRHLQRRFYDSSACIVDENVNLSKSHTVVCESGVIACWHPEKLFSYEHTKPIDLKKLETEKKGSSALNKETKRIADLQGSLAKTGPRNHMLREIFYTGKHEWYTRQREDRLRSVAAPEPKRRN